MLSTIGDLKGARVMKRKHKGSRLLILIIILTLSFFSINNILNKKTVIAEDKIPANSAGKGNDVVDIIIENATISLDGTTYEDENGNTVIKNTDDLLVLVNKSRNLPSTYAPKDLVIPNVKFSFKENLEKKYMRKDAAKALEELFSAAKEDGINLFAVSGYRSYKRQKEIFNAKAKVYGHEVANKTSAMPGQSEHQTGLAMDISSESEGYQLTEKFGQTSEGKWLTENAHRFGFIIRYPKDKTDMTGYVYEPWHVRYVGKDAAITIKEKNIILEEYFN